MKIKAEDLTRIFRVGPSEIMAVGKASFEISKPAFTVIIGRSGSGKSTLLNLIGLNDCPTSGKIHLDDTDVSLLPNSQRRKIRLFRMGFIFQTFNLFPTLSALENVELPMALAGKPPKHQMEKATSLLESVGLGKRLLHRPKQLSMGEMQRVAIARAIANDPEVIIADEPTGELDSKTAKDIIALLFDISRKGKTIIVATHDERIADVSDVTYTIEDGKLRFEG